MSWLAEYGLFIAQVTTVALLFLVLPLALVAAGKRKSAAGALVDISTTLLNERIEKDANAIKCAVSIDDKKAKKAQAKEKKAQKRNKDERQVIIVLDFNGDIKASANNSLSRFVNAILAYELPIAEVVLRLESGGGLVHAYGLAASQLLRLRDAGVKLTICVDKVAASGGYMMAVTAHKIVSAPYAIVGSIGVIAQLPNFNRFLQKHSIDFEQITAGEYKRKLTMFGENTPAGREKMTEDIVSVHQLFKSFVYRYRPNIEIDEVANGDTWFGIEAIDRGLVDELATSDGYLLQRSKQYRLLHLSIERKKNLVEKLFSAISAGTQSLFADFAGFLHRQTQEK